MKVLKLVKSFFAASTLLFACSSNASLLSVNGVGVNALDLNGSVSSLNEFYGYGTSTIWSSNTGFEVANEVVMFFGTLNNNLALFTTISGDGGSAGALEATITGTDGAISFLDDADEIVNGSTISWIYGAGKSDGLVYSLFTGDDWNINFDFLSSTAVAGLSFLTFDANGTASQALVQTSLTNLTVSSTEVVAAQVPAPSTLLLFSLGLIFAVRKRFL